MIALPFASDAFAPDLAAGFFVEAFFSVVVLDAELLEEPVSSALEDFFEDNFALEAVSLVFLEELFFEDEAFFSCLVLDFFASVLSGFSSEASLTFFLFSVAFGTSDSFRQKPYLDIASP